VLVPLFLGFAAGVAAVVALQRHRHRQHNRAGAGPASSALTAAQLLAWIDAADQGWMVLGSDLRITYINDRAERLLRLSRNRLVRGKPLNDVLSIPQLDEAIISTSHLQRPQRSEWELRGEPLEAVVLPGSDEWLLVLIQSRQSLEAQQQQQERWVSDVAHELKTPLTALMLVADRLAQAVPSKDLVLVERLQRELQRLKVMVEDLLELSRLENCLPQDGSGYVPISLEDLVNNAWSSIRPLADNRSVRLSLESSDEGRLLGDQRRLYRAVLNLLDNALRHSPDDDTVDVRILSSGAWWILRIRDHGSGLSESDLKRMFQRFYRGDPSRVRSARSGSGLGLSIVQQIAVNHGGRIEARNHPDGGACLELLLPKEHPAGA
tara:strand:- start:329 stop:1465 length:1137 start_codon:yes stop_codon:yes gene_type:complete